MFIEYFVSTALGISLVALVAALILNPGFRTDLSAPTQGNHMSFFGLSVQGAVIVVLFAIIIGALVYIIHQYFKNIQAKALANELRILPSELGFPTANKAEALQKISEMRSKADSMSKETTLAQAVENLSFNSPSAETIRNLAKTRRGPWGVSDKAMETFLTVPENITKGSASACPYSENRSYQIRSNLPDADRLSGEATTVVFGKPLVASADCEQKYKLIHVACDIATRVLGDAVVTCDSKNKPLWKNRGSKHPIYHTEVAA